MRKQDELLVLYPHQDRFNKKFILTEIDGLSRTFDSDDLLELLRREVGSPDPVVAHQAFFGLTLFLPGFIARRFGVAPTEQGLWTRYEASAAPGSAGAAIAATLDHDATRDLVYAGLEPVARSLYDHMELGSEPVRKLARLALSQFPYRFLQQSILERSAREPDFELTMALARMGAGLAGPAAFSSKVTVEATRQASMYLSLVALSPEDLSREVVELAPRAGRLGRANLAIAISKHADPSILDGVRALIDHRESWVDVYAMRALQGTGAPGAMKEVVALYERQQNSFVRCQALRTLGDIGGRGSLEFLMDRARDPDPAIQAQALESLIRLRCPRQDLMKVADPLRDSPSIRTRVNAWLAIADPREAKKPTIFTELAQRAEPLHRLEGAYSLGYWQGADSVRALRRLALEDPEDSVRIQAVKSLSRFPAAVAGGPLLEVLAGGRDRLALCASRVLTRYEGDEARLVVGAVMDALRSAKTPLEATLLMRAMGSLAGKAGVEEAELVMVKNIESPDPRVVRAALEGWKLYGTSRRFDLSHKLDELARSADAEIALAATTVKLLQGRWDAVTQLADRLARPADEGWNRAVETALEWGLLAAEVIPLGRFEALRVPATPPSMQRPAITLGWAPRVTGVTALGAGDGMPVHELADAAAPPKPDREGASSGGVPRARASARTADRPRNQNLVEDLLRSTYHLGRHVADAALEGEARFQHLGPRWRTAAAFLWMNRFLLPIPLVVLLLVSYQVVGVSTSISQPTTGSPAPAALTVLHVEGLVSLGDGTRPAAGGSVVAGGEVRLEEASRLRLRSLLGSEIRVIGPGRILVPEVDADGHRMTLELDVSEAQLHAAPEETLHLLASGARVVLSDAEIRITNPDGGPALLEVRSGLASLESPAGSPARALATGTKQPLAP